MQSSPAGQLAALSQAPNDALQNFAAALATSAAHVPPPQSVELAHGRPVRVPLVQTESLTTALGSGASRTADGPPGTQVSFAGQSAALAQKIRGSLAQLPSGFSWLVKRKRRHIRVTGGVPVGAWRSSSW